MQLLVAGNVLNGNGSNGCSVGRFGDYTIIKESLSSCNELLAKALIHDLLECRPHGLSDSIVHGCQERRRNEYRLEVMMAGQIFHYIQRCENGGNIIHRMLVGRVAFQPSGNKLEVR